MLRTAAIALTALIVATALCRIVSADDSPVPLHRELPKISVPNHEDYYPLQAKRRGLEGVVSIAFSIDGKGRVVNPAVLYSDTDDFSAKALRLLSVARFAVPSDWEGSGKHDVRYLISIRFQLKPCGHPRDFQLQDLSIDICGSRLVPSR